MFGSNTKYLFVFLGLSLLMLSPAMIDQVSDGIAYNSQTASIGDALKQFRKGFDSNLLKLDDRERSISSSSRPVRPPFVGTTSPAAGKLDPKDIERKDDRRVNPQEVVTLLYKAGIISQDKLDQARKIIANARLATSTRSLPPPPPPLPASSTPSTTPM